MKHWFITSYDQIQLVDGFIIQFTTDVPCHLCIYWTIHKPWTHRVAGYLRGVPHKFFAYFCFVSWNKFCQTEGGDTLFHSFELHDWPYCQTRWFVFYGNINDEPSPSVSPIFEKHNSYIIAPPCHWCAANHERLRTPRIGGWQDIKWPDSTPLRVHLPPTTVALCLHCKNEGAGQAFGLRQKGSTHNVTHDIGALGHQWSVVGVNSQIEAQLYESGLNPVELYLEGYVLKGGVVMFVNPMDYTPAGDLTWVTINLAASCPNAIGIIAELVVEPFNYPSGIRQTGSSDDYHDKVSHLFTIIGCNSHQQIDFYTCDRIGRKGHLYIHGYITEHASFYLNALDKTPTILDAWQTITVAKPSNLAFFEVLTQPEWEYWQLRPKGSTFHELRKGCPYHSWAIIPVDLIGQLEGNVSEAVMRFLQVGEGH